MKIKGLGSIIAGVLLVFFCVVIIGVGIRRIGGFIDTPSLAIIFGITGGYLLLAYGIIDVYRAAVLCLKGRAESEKAALKAIEVCRAAAYTSIISGVIGMMIGLINMLSQGMDDPTVLSCGAAVALLTVFYGVLAAGLFYVLEGRCRIALLNVPSPASSEAFAASDREEKVKRPLLLFFSGVLASFALLMVFVLIAQIMKDPPNIVAVRAQIKNNAANRVVLITDPLYAETPGSNYGHKPVLASGGSIYTDAHVVLDRGLRGIMFTAADLESGKVYRLTVPLDDKALAVSGKLELVIEESGIKIVDNSAQDRPQDNK